jgi:predicted dehydrogenase
MLDVRNVARTVTVGLIGLGYWGPNLLRVLADDGDVEVKWICDRDPDRLARLARRYPATTPTSLVDVVLGDPEVDAVLIATPVTTHYDLASAALAAGKHTFIEKPLASSTPLADALLAQADATGRVLMCGHTFLYSPPVRAVKSLLESGVLGELYFVSSSRVNLGPYRGDVSVVWDLGPHDFSILHYWFGEAPSLVRATGRDALATGIADIAFVSMSFGHGVVANIELSWLAPSKLRRTVLVGSEKMIVYADGAPEPVRIYDHGIVLGDPETFGQYQLSYRTGDIISPKVEAAEPLMSEIADFMRAVRESDPMTWQARLARDVVSISEAAETSLKAGGVAVRVGGGLEPEPRVAVTPAAGAAA